MRGDPVNSTDGEAACGHGRVARRWAEHGRVFPAGPSRNRTVRAEPPGTDLRRPGREDPIVVGPCDDDASAAGSCIAGVGVTDWNSREQC
jgi:hypothetical protein